MMSLDHTDKWHRMLDIVSRYQEVSQSQLSWDFKKLYISRLLTENILTFLLQYIGLMLVGGLTPQSIVPLWYSSGSACAFVFMRGFSVLPGVFLGSFCAYYFSSSSLFQSGSSATVDAIQAFLLFWLSYRYISPTLIFNNLSKFVKFILCCGIITGISSFIIGSLYYQTFTFQRWLPYWLGNVNGILVFSLAILTWDLYVLEIDHLKQLNRWMFVFCFGLLIINIINLLSSTTPFFIVLFSSTTLPIVLLISLQLGWCGVIAAVLLLGLCLNFGIYLNAPLFSTQFSQLTLIYIQAILVIETIVGLCVTIRLKYGSLN